MTRITLAAGILFATLPAFSASGQWTETFDCYEVGPLADQSAWVAWLDDPIGAGFDITAERRSSPTNALAIDGFDDAVHQFFGYEFGAWIFRTKVWIDADMDDAQAFILLNTYPPAQDGDWSLQIQFDGAGNIVRDVNSGETLPLVRDAWVDLLVHVDLDADRQTIEYDGQTLLTKSWTTGVDEGGALRIAAVDLFADGSAHTVFYDDMLLESVTACPADLDGDGMVSFGDLLIVLGAWGPCGGCLADIDGDGMVSFGDLLFILADWGPCPVSDCSFIDVRTTVCGPESDPPHVQRNYDTINRTVHVLGGIPLSTFFAATLDELLPAVVDNVANVEACTGIPTHGPDLVAAWEGAAAAAAGLPLSAVFTLLPDEDPLLHDAVDAIRAAGLGLPPFPESDLDAEARALAIAAIIADAGDFELGDFFFREPADVPLEVTTAIEFGKVTRVLKFEAIEDELRFGICDNDRCCEEDGGRDGIVDACNELEDHMCGRSNYSGKCFNASDDCP